MRPISRLDKLSYYSELCDRVRTLVGENLSAEDIAERLGAEGYQSPRDGKGFGRQRVLNLINRLGLRKSRARPQGRRGLGENEWWLVDLARTPRMPRGTLSYWIDMGLVKARQEEQSLRRWIIWADEAEIERLRRSRELPAIDTAREAWKRRPLGTDTLRLAVLQRDHKEGGNSHAA